MRREKRFLVNHRNSGGRRFRGIAKSDRGTAKPNFPAVRSNHAGDDFHERGFSGAVLSHQEMNFASFNAQVSGLKRLYTAKVLLNGIEFEQQTS